MKALRYLVAALVVLAVVAMMTTYSVRFTEKAVVTTFGKADEGSVQHEPGLRFKFPYPVQTVVKYDTRARLVETRSETVATKDNKQVILAAFVTWRVKDPLKFFRLYGNAGSREIEHYRAAEAAILPKLRTELAQTARFDLTELLSRDPAGSKLEVLEKDVLGALTAGPAAAAFAEGGIEPMSVGISSIRLPQGTTTAVLERMRETRTTLADRAIQQGKAIAEGIRNQASADADKILAFASQRATIITSLGQAEAAPYLAALKADEEFAVFLQRIEFIRRANSQRGITLVLSPEQLGLNFAAPTVQRAGDPAPAPSAASPAPISAPALGAKEAP